MSGPARHGGWCAALVAFVALACGGRERPIAGQVTDFATGRPVAGAVVTAAWRGWGRAADGGVVWDKDFAARGESDAQGRFRVVYRGPSSVQLTVGAAGYEPFTHWYGAGADVAVRLKRSDPGYRPLPAGILSLGEAPGGRAGAARLGGWRFAPPAETADTAAADLVVSAFSLEPRVRVVVRAVGRGGVRFVPAREIGVDGGLLTYTDEAPAAGYAQAAALEPGQRPGVLFVRTRDGGHYAKVEVSDAAMTEQAAGGGRRAAMFRYVYNPDGGRDLRFQEPGAAR